MTDSVRPPKDAILIGPGRWISHVDLSGRYASAIEVDSWIVELEPLWRLLETDCVAACCGVDAFDFSPDRLSAAMQNLNRSDVCTKMAALRDRVISVQSGAFVSRRLNSYFDRSVLVALLDHLCSHCCPETQ